MSIEPIGWLYRLVGKADTTLVPKNKVKNFEQFNLKWCKSSPVYEIPDTHRIVPVELLEAVVDDAWPAAGVLSQLRAIIEAKP